MYCPLFSLSSLFFNDYLFERQNDWEGERGYILWLTPWMPTTAGIGSGQISSLGFHLGVHRGWLGPSYLNCPCCLPSTLTGSWIRILGARTWTSIPLWNVGVQSNRLTQLYHSVYPYLTFVNLYFCLHLWVYWIFILKLVYSKVCSH